MDRGRHRAFLTPILLAGFAAGWLAGAAPLRAQGNGSPVPSVAMPPAAPSPAATPDAVRKRAAEKAMMERRQREQTASQLEAQHRIEQLPPEERESFKRNLRIWREFSPEEREVVRKEADERIRVEIEKALQDSGLHLDKDRREVFALRYRQERRRMERELQEKLETERTRRLPAILEGLKREFADRATVPPPPASATTSRSTPSVSVPASTP